MSERPIKTTGIFGMWPSGLFDWAAGTLGRWVAGRKGPGPSLLIRNSSFVDKTPSVIDSPNEKSEAHIIQDRRRKHHHWQVTVFYKDEEPFSRICTVHEKAAGFAERQKKSPVVKMARVIEIS